MNSAIAKFSLLFLALVLATCGPTPKEIERKRIAENQAAEQKKEEEKRHSSNKERYINEVCPHWNKLKSGMSHEEVKRIIENRFSPTDHPHWRTIMKEGFVKESVTTKKTKISQETLYTKGPERIIIDNRLSTLIAYDNVWCPISSVDDYGRQLDWFGKSEGFGLFKLE